MPKTSQLRSSFPKAFAAGFLVLKKVGSPNKFVHEKTLKEPWLSVSRFLLGGMGVLYFSAPHTAKAEGGALSTRYARRSKLYLGFHDSLSKTRNMVK